MITRTPYDRDNLKIDVYKRQELLRNTGNPVFRSDKKQDIIRALKEARHLSARGKGEANYAYAIGNIDVYKRQGLKKPIFH